MIDVYPIIHRALDKDLPILLEGAQGVLLEYPGCKSHWSERGEPTEVNVARVVETIKGK